MTKYKRRDNILAESLQDHLVMLDLDKGNYYSLNQVANLIWDLLEHAQSSEELCHELMNEFEVNEVQCKKEVEELLVEMKKLKLISVVE